jgi:hypothetical protein
LDCGHRLRWLDSLAAASIVEEAAMIEDLPQPNEVFDAFARRHSGPDIDPLRGEFLHWWELPLPLRIALLDRFHKIAKRYERC